MSNFVFSPAVQAQIDALEEEIHQLKRRQTLLERRIDELKAGQSPLKVGDIIVWESGKCTKRGRILSVACNSYCRGFEYRCVILGKNDQEIGYATVGSERGPLLEGGELPYEDQPVPPQG